MPDLEAARARAARELAMLSPRTKRFLNPQPYPVGLDGHVHRRKQRADRRRRGRAMHEPLVFSTHAYDYLADAIAQAAAGSAAARSRKTFPDGEHYRRIDTDPADRDVDPRRRNDRRHDHARALRPRVRARHVRRVSHAHGHSVLRLLDDGALGARRRDRDREDARAPAVVDPDREPRHAGVPARPPRRRASRTTSRAASARSTSTARS